MAISQIELKNRIKAAYDDVSQVQIDPAVARELLADKIAKAINDFVIGRSTQVTGVDSAGDTLTQAQGVIQ